MKNVPFRVSRAARHAIHGAALSLAMAGVASAAVDASTVSMRVENNRTAVITYRLAGQPPPPRPGRRPRPLIPGAAVSALTASGLFDIGRWQHYHGSPGVPPAPGRSFASHPRGGGGMERNAQFCIFLP
ncbi:MAG: hypothetical protein IKH04_08690 [Kiritimatiellae bacterium]|nr:hypothetical protein [Kiritimatiellia bacterium]